MRERAIVHRRSWFNGLSQMAVGCGQTGRQLQNGDGVNGRVQIEHNGRKGGQENKPTVKMARKKPPHGAAAHLIGSLPPPLKKRGRMPEGTFSAVLSRR